MGRKGKTYLLSKIHRPQDVREFNRGELRQLAEEIRNEIIQTVSDTGGHLASNLGVVELTIALHYVFNPPRDKIINNLGCRTPMLSPQAPDREKTVFLYVEAVQRVERLPQEGGESIRLIQHWPQQYLHFRRARDVRRCFPEG
jgi:hypothetical protein